MFDSLFLSLREGLEAALIIGIILAQITRIGRRDLSKFVYTGTLLGVIISAVVGFIGFSEAQEAGEAGEELIEGIMMLLSAGLIAYFILWIHRNQGHTSAVTEKVAKNTSSIGLFVLSFLSVVREGIELVVFNLTKITESSFSVAIGSVSGIILAVLLAIILFKTSIKLNLSLIFKALGILLIFVGGEMFGEGLVKLFEGGEILEEIGMAAFIILSLSVFLWADLQQLWKSRIAAK
jgi:high-affinity iron transporter